MRGLVKRKIQERERLVTAGSSADHKTSGPRYPAHAEFAKLVMNKTFLGRPAGLEFDRCKKSHGGTVAAYAIILLK